VFGVCVRSLDPLRPMRLYYYLLHKKTAKKLFSASLMQIYLSIYPIGFVEEIFCTMKYQLYSFEILFVQW
jgi:hypothetical protein